MTTIVTRAGKGSSLTWTEGDANFTNLNNDKLEANGALGTPSSGTLTNCTGLPAAGVSGTALVAAAIGTTVQAYDADLSTWAGVTPGTGVATALAVNVGSAGAPVVLNGALGTPSSGNLSNCTGYPATSGITLATPQASTSGSAITFLSIPSGTKRITMMFNAVSTNGSNVPRVQLGDAGGLETTGYTALIMLVYASAADALESTTGFTLRETWGASFEFSGSIVFTHMGSNVWTAQGSGRVNTNTGATITGVKTLSAELDRIALVTTDTFDAGTINIMYET
jgi:hypothetical protein